MTCVFRYTTGEIVSTLTRCLGPAKLEMAEAIAQETLVRATRCWPFEGVPDQPDTWLKETAKRIAFDRLMEERAGEEKMNFQLGSISLQTRRAFEENFDADGTGDPLTLMMLCASPEIPRVGRPLLLLKAVGGLGVKEISQNLIIEEEAVHDALRAARRKLRRKKVTFALPDAKGFSSRMKELLELIHLIFIAGYPAPLGSSGDPGPLWAVTRWLLELILRHPKAKRLPEAHALMALVCLQSGRYPESHPNQTLIQKGMSHLKRSLDTSAVGEYHWLATIVACHATAEEHDATDWETLVTGYDSLLCRSSFRGDPERCVRQAAGLFLLYGGPTCLETLNQMRRYSRRREDYLLPATQGELHARRGDHQQASLFFREALSLASTPLQKRLLMRRLNSL